MEKKFLRCLICKKQFKHLGSHIWHKHKILAKEYKEEFELPYNWGLISDEIKEKKSEKAKWLKTWIKNFKDSKKYQFKKGKTGQRRVSQTERKIFIKRILDLNKKKKSKMESCPVCKMKFYHIESHLYNKHGLLKIKRSVY
jgi:hypothetical protein